MSRRGFLLEPCRMTFGDVLGLLGVAFAAGVSLAYAACKIAVGLGMSL
jgi:hypothetical protein